jgi:hypothetical protein
LIHLIKKNKLVLLRKTTKNKLRMTTVPGTPIQAPDDGTIYSEEITYNRPKRAHGDYQYTKLYQLSGGTSQVVNVTGISESTFEIPGNQVINLARSYIRFDVRYPAGADATYQRVSVLGLPMFERVQFNTKSGTVLADCNQIPAYLATVGPYHTSLHDMRARDKFYPNLPGSNGSMFVDPGAVLGLVPARIRNDFNLANYGGAAGAQFTGLAEVEIQPPTLASGAVGIWTEPTDEVPSFVRGVQALAATPAGAVSMSYVVPLSTLIPDSLLSMNRDLYFAESMHLTINWAGSSSYVSIGTSATVPATGNVPTTLAPVVSNYNLYVATEQSTDVIMKLRNKVRTGDGLQLIIPYVNCYKLSLGNTTSDSVQTRISSAHGHNLLRIWTAAFAGGGAEPNTGFYSLNHSNQNDLMISNLYDELDSIRLESRTLTSDNDDLYLALRDRLQGSLIHNSQLYKQHQVWLRDFTGLQTVDMIENNCNSDGLSLGAERIYSVTSDHPAGLRTYYTFVVTQRQMTINSVGVSIV